jgi:hypothetical protein
MDLKKYIFFKECTSDEHCPNGVCHLESCVGKQMQILTMKYSTKLLSSISGI